MKYKDEKAEVDKEIEAQEREIADFEAEIE